MAAAASGEAGRDSAKHHEGDCLELPVEELLQRARPMPSHDEMVIEDLTVEEGDAFLEALEA